MENGYKIVFTSANKATFIFFGGVIVHFSVTGDVFYHPVCIRNHMGTSADLTFISQ